MPYGALTDEALAHGAIPHGALKPGALASGALPELFLIQTIQTDLPNANHHEYYFHFTQSIWRQVQILGLTADYRTDDIV